VITNVAPRPRIAFQHDLPRVAPDDLAANAKTDTLTAVLGGGNRLGNRVAYTNVL